MSQRFYRSYICGCLVTTKHKGNGAKTNELTYLRLCPIHQEAQNNRLALEREINKLKEQLSAATQDLKMVKESLPNKTSKVEDTGVLPTNIDDSSADIEEYIRQKYIKRVQDAKAALDRVESRFTKEEGQ